jgi:multiple sugar transport system substrate-binding protein
MADPRGQWSPRYRVFVIALVIVFAIVIVTASTLLVKEVEWHWTVSSVLLWVPIGVVILTAGVITQSLVTIMKTIWHQPEASVRIIDLASWLGRVWRRPAKAVVVGLVAVFVVGLGIFLRPAPTGLESGPLVVMTAFGDSASDPRSILIRQWNQLHPENQVSIDFAPGEPDQQNQRMVNDAKLDGENRADIYLLDLVWMPQFVDHEYIQPFDSTRLSDADLADFVPKVLDTCKRDGKLWGLPLNTDAGLIFYRSDVPGVGPPERWDDYFGTSAKSVVANAKRGGVRLEAANAAQLRDEEVLTIAALESIWAAGGELVGTNGQVLLTPDSRSVHFSQADRNGIRNLAAAANDDQIVLAQNDEARNSTETEALEAFANGRTAYMRNWPVARDRIGDRVQFDIAAPPTASVLGGQNLAIAASTDKPRAAQAFIEFLTNPSSQLIISEVGGFAPTRQSAFSNSERPGSQELLTAVNSARLRPVVPNYTDFSRLFRQGIARALNNGGKFEAAFPRELADVLRR